MPDLQDRLRGIAVGAAVGDALGMPLEFRPPRPEYDLVTEMIPGPLPAGTFTDDTEMALCLAESLLLNSPLNSQDLAARFTGWYQSQPSDIGIHTAQVLKLIAQGLSYNEAARRVQAEDPESAGNGSLMRAWPLVIARYENQGLLTSESILQSEVTHPHVDCINGALLVNFIIFQILQHGSQAPEAAIRQAIVQATGQVALDPDFLLMVNLAPLRMRKDLKNSGWVRHTVESSLWAIMTTRSFEEALVKVINLGNDADTAGCVTGAIAGALYGLSGIPQRWRKELHGEYPIHSGKLWFEQDFIHLADQLSQLQ